MHRFVSFSYLDPSRGAGPEYQNADFKGKFFSIWIQNIFVTKLRNEYMIKFQSPQEKSIMPLQY